MDAFEIDAKVMERYPVTEDERRCNTIKSLMKKVRDDYRTKLKKQHEQAAAGAIQPEKQP